MVPPADEVLFERFRARGDAPALGELFDRSAPALLRIALHLARDQAGAEDLVQATFLLAIEARSEWDARRPLMPWLCGILQNRARTERKRETRAPDPARLPAEAPLDPGRAAEHAEFDAAVDAAIAELPEIYRPVLRLHLAYGHEPVAIAHALERPSGTVRSQLARGLELLRKLLPVGFAGGAALVLTAGRGLGAVRTAVMSHAAAAAVGVAGIATFTGGVLLMKKLVGVSVVALLAAALWLVSSAPHGAELPAPMAPAPVAAASTSAAQPADMSAIRSPRAAVPPPAGAAMTALRITCRFAEDRSLAAGVLLVVAPSSVSERAFRERTVTTGEDGTALVSGLQAGKTDVEAERGGKLSLELFAGMTSDAELVIPPGIHVRGRVVDALGLPVPAARVWLSVGPKRYSHGRHVAAVGADGRFVLRSVEPDRFLGADAPGLRAAVLQQVVGSVGGTVETQLVLRGPGATLVGTVLDPRGEPVADACVLVGHRENWGVWDARTFAEWRPPIDLRSDTRGEFRVDGLALGSRVVLWVRGDGFCTWRESVPLRAEGVTELTIRLQHGATVSGTVTDGGGQPVDRALVRCVSSALAGDDFVQSSAPEWAHLIERTGPDGKYRIATAAPGTMRLQALGVRRETRGEVVAAEGESVTWDPVLVDLAISGRVIDERGAPLVGLSVTGQPPRGKGNMFAGVRTDADGRFRWQGLVDVPYRLDVCESAGVRACPIATRLGVLPGTDVVITVADAAIPSAVIEGTVVDTDSRPPVRAQVRLAGDHIYWQPTVPVDPATGRFRFTPLRPGTYRVQAGVGEWPKHRRSAWSAPLTVSANKTIDVGVIQMPVGGSILVTVRTEGDAKGLEVGLEESHGAGSTCFGYGKVENGEIRISDLAPGSYRLRFYGPDLPQVSQPVTVVSSEETRVETLVPVGVRCRLQFTSVTESAPIHETFVWMRDGLPWQSYTNWVEGVGGHGRDLRLLPGAYEVTITSETGKRAINRFLIAASDPPGREIPIRMP